MSNLPITVVAFNRPNRLKRLLKSLSRAEYPSDSSVLLTISIDGGGQRECVRIAEEFEWRYGDKVVIANSEHFGLKNHILTCGKSSIIHEAVIVLEDDLVVSSQFYRFASDAYHFYKENESIASIALYSYKINEFCNYPFESIADEWDAFFMKVPCSWGQVFIGKRWSEFESFENSISDGLEDEFISCTVSKKWSPHSWKKAFFRYLIQKQKYVVYPCHSFSDNCGDAGTNIKNESSYLSTGLSQHPGPYRFPTMDETVNVYDQFMEWDSEYLDRRTDEWIDCEMDIYGNKPLQKIKKPFVLTSREVHQEIRSVPAWLSPIQMNAVAGLGPVGDSNCRLKVAKVEHVIDAKMNPTLDSFYGVRVSPKISEFHLRRGSDIQRRYFLNKGLVKYGMVLKRLFRKLIPSGKK